VHRDLGQHECKSVAEQPESTQEQEKAGEQPQLGAAHGQLLPQAPGRFERDPSEVGEHSGRRGERREPDYRHRRTPLRTEENGDEFAGGSGHAETDRQSDPGRHGERGYVRLSEPILIPLDPAERRKEDLGQTSA